RADHSLAVTSKSLRRFVPGFFMRFWRRIRGTLSLPDPALHTAITGPVPRVRQSLELASAVLPCSSPFKLANQRRFFCLAIWASRLDRHSSTERSSLRPVAVGADFLIGRMGAGVGAAPFAGSADASSPLRLALSS